MKIRLITLSLAALAISVNAQSKKKKTKVEEVQIVAVDTVRIMTELDSASYSFGLKIASGLKSDGVKTLNYELLSKGMQDVFASQKLLISDEEAGPAINAFLKRISESRFAGAKEEAAKFLEENKKNPKITSTASGLQYEVITLGTGPKPLATDEVTVHYQGSLTNGTEFDSSYERGEPIKLSLNGVIKGWTEGVQLMPTGSKFRFYIPYELGYGERGSGEVIPPFSTLIFDIELLKIGG
jgi:FKBP-type peptidyl-prolyl cis-trans isomerase